jgi:hypothetical protein
MQQATGRLIVSNKLNNQQSGMREGWERVATVTAVIAGSRRVENWWQWRQQSISQSATRKGRERDEEGSKVEGAGAAAAAAVASNKTSHKRGEGWGRRHNSCGGCDKQWH